MFSVVQFRSIGANTNIDESLHTKEPPKKPQKKPLKLRCLGGLLFIGNQ